MSALFRKRTLNTLLAPLAIAVGLSGQAQASQYSITDLGALLGGSTSSASSINNHGEVAGTSGGLGFVYSQGTVTTFGTSAVSIGKIREDGSVVGGNAGEAFLYKSGTLNQLSIWGGSGSMARSINASGQIVGWANKPGEVGSHAFLYESGVVTDLGALGSYPAGAIDINDQGQIVGYSTGSMAFNGFLYQNGTLTGAGKWGGYDEVPAAISESGVIVGTQGAWAVFPHAYVYNPNDLTYQIFGTLGGFDSRAEGINAAGDIVGSSLTSAAKTHAILIKNGSMLDINGLIDTALGWELTAALDINDSGQIVGYGTIDGQQRAFLLTPVPVPAAAWMFGSATVGLLGIARRRRV